MMKKRDVNAQFPVIARAFTACRSGAAMFELALTLPILLIIFAGGWEMARGLWTYDMLNKGVRDAARYLARLDDPTTTAAETKALYLVLTGDMAPGQPPRLDHNHIDVDVGVRTFANASGTYRSKDGAAGPIDVVQVVAEYSFDARLLGFLGIATPITITVAHEERHIGD